MMSNEDKLKWGLVAGIALVLLLAFLGVERAKRDPGFCVTCHLKDGTPLHAVKERFFAAQPPHDLAAYHRTKERSFTCGGCHEGGTVRGAIAVRWAEVRNTFVYFFKTVKEPEALSEGMMPDAACARCHGSFTGGKYTFHGSVAHQPSIKFPCIACHAAHAQARPDYYYLSRERMDAVCAKCHNHIPAVFNERRGSAGREGAF